jgi:hypothetical protein
MTAPNYSLTNYFGTTDPAGDILTLLEAKLVIGQWVFVEEVAFTQAATARIMRVWKCPSTLNAAGVDFYVGFVKDAVAGIYFAVRAFEGWDVTAKTMQRPVLPASSVLLAAWGPIVYGGGVYVAMITTAGANSCVTSTDGITWTTRKVLTTTALAYGGLAYGNGVFVALQTGSSNVAVTSPDGITWTARTMPATSTWSAVTYGGSQFVAVNSAGTNAGATSPDGITWTSRTTTTGTWTSVAYGAGVYVAVPSSGTAAMSSPDGITWTSRTIISGSYTQVIFANGVFSAINSAAATSASSTNGTTWTSRTMPASGFRSVAYGNSTFVATGSAGVVATSPDAITWTTRGPLASFTWSQVGYGTGFTAICQSYVSATSADGITWANGRGAGLASDAAILDYLPTGATTPLMADAGIGVAASTNYDIAILVSKSYFVLGINLNGLSTQVGNYAVGLYAPAYAESQSSTPPLMILSLLSGINTSQSGVSRATRVPVDSIATFAIGATPESLLLGSFSGQSGLPNTGSRELVTDSIRGSRVALVSESSHVGGGFTRVAGGMRGWLLDCVAVAFSDTTTGRPKVGDTVTIGGVTWTLFGSNSTGSLQANPSYFGCFFNTTTGS